MFQVISLGDSNSSNQQTREYKRRRTHKKTRAGCLGCKQRRVKCDQAIPACLRCRRNKRPCEYEDGSGSGSGSGENTSSRTRPKGQQSEESSQTLLHDSSSDRHSSFSGTATTGAQRPVPGVAARGGGQGNMHIPNGHTSGRLVSVTAFSRPVPRFVRAQPLQMTGFELGTPPNELMHHFEAAGSGLFDMPNFMGPLLPLAIQFSHLRGTILAATASHLFHKSPGFKDYHIAQHYQQSVALQAYQTALSTSFAAQGQLGVDVLLMTAMLMNMLAFVMPLDEGEQLVHWDGSQPGTPPPCANPDPDPRHSWVFSSQPNRLGWLALQMGLTPLLIATTPWREHSRLRLLFANSDDERRTLSGTWQSLRRVPQTWLKLFGFSRDSTAHPGFRGSGVTTPASDSSSNGSSPNASYNSPDSGITENISEADRLYRAPLRVVAELRMMEANDRNLLQYFQFIGQLDKDFREKLLERDEKALWLFGMWMGLLCRFPNVWWTRRRTRCDFRAIRLWLHLVGVASRPGAEGQMWRELLKDLDGTWGYEFDSDPIVHRV